MAQTDKNIFNGTAGSPFKRAEKHTLIFDMLIIMFVVMMAFGVSVVLREYVVTSTYVKGASMEGTLFTGDNVYLFNLGKIKRGDIVRIENPDYNPSADDKYIIKRVIALAGDHVKIPGDGYVYVNGEKLDDGYTNDPGNTFYRSENNDPEHKYKNGGIIPDGYVFVLGDNRIISKDSRSFGEVKEDAIRGRAFLIIRDGKWEWI
jgi:signal peptidase I